MAIRLAGKRFEYTLQADIESEVPSIFLIKELTHGERVRIADIRPTDGETSAQTHSWLEDVCRIGLIEVRHCMDAEGALVSLPAADVLDQLRDPATIRELAMAVLTLNTLTEAEKKTSASRSGRKPKT